MSQAARDPRGELLARFVDLERRLQRLERSPSGDGTFGTKQIGTLPACVAYRTADQSIASGGFTALAPDGELFDTDGMHDPAVNPSRLTATTAGYYVVTAGISWAFNATGQRVVRIGKNGGTTQGAEDARQAITTGAANTSCTTSAIVKLAVGDYVEAYGFQDSGGALNATAGARLSFLGAAWLSR